MTDTTPTGVPIRLCASCGTKHPTTRRHCNRCGKPSLFIRPTGACIHCQAKQPALFEVVT